LNDERDFPRDDENQLGDIYRAHQRSIAFLQSRREQIYNYARTILARSIRLRGICLSTAVIDFAYLLPDYRSIAQYPCP
jgi:hypothetical protein